jgi:hypothetical protein
MSFGSVYTVSWWGDVNASNGWGIIYPFDADGSAFTIDSNETTIDSAVFTIDKTTY